MSNASHFLFDVVVIGGGPAGIAAATVAAESGSSVALLDDNSGIGGQIWRQENRTSKHPVTRSWFERCEGSSARIFRGARVFHVERGQLVAESSDSTFSITYKKLILA